MPRMAGPCTFHSQQLQADPGGASSSSSGLSLPSRVFSLTVGNARAHSRGRFSRADQPTTGPSVVGMGRRARSQRPARRAPLPKITGCLSSSPARGLTNRRERERERGAPSGRQRALWRTSRANQPTVRAFATFRLSNNICSLLMWRSAGV